MLWWQVALLGVAVVLLVDRIMAGLEARGLVHWRRRKATSGAATTGMLQVQSLLEPAAQHVVDERVRAASEIEEAADDDPLSP